MSADDASTGHTIKQLWPSVRPRYHRTSWHQCADYPISPSGLLSIDAEEQLATAWQRCVRFLHVFLCLRPRSLCPSDRYTDAGIGVGAELTIGTRRQRKEVFAAWTAENWGTCDVIAELPSGQSRAELENAVYQWAARVNRRYLGRNWFKPEYATLRLTGVAHFEEGLGGWHAHLLLNPPKGIDPLKFVQETPYVWSSRPRPDLPEGNRRGLVRGGKMFARVIGPSISDRLRVARYDAKALELHEDDSASMWKFIDQLTPLRRDR